MTENRSKISLPSLCLRFYAWCCSSRFGARPTTNTRSFAYFRKLPNRVRKSKCRLTATNSKRPAKFSSIVPGFPAWRFETFPSIRKMEEWKRRSRGRRSHFDFGSPPMPRSESISFGFERKKSYRNFSVSGSLHFPSWMRSIPFPLSMILRKRPSLCLSTARSSDISPPGRRTTWITIPLPWLRGSSAPRKFSAPVSGLIITVA